MSPVDRPRWYHRLSKCRVRTENNQQSWHIGRFDPPPTLTRTIRTYPAAKTINPNLIDPAIKLTRKAMICHIVPKRKVNKVNLLVSLTSSARSPRQPAHPKDDQGEVSYMFAGLLAFKVLLDEEKGSKSLFISDSSTGKEPPDSELTIRPSSCFFTASISRVQSKRAEF